VQGYLQPVLWPGSPGLNARVLTWLAVALCICHCAFAMSFLQLRERQPWGHRGLAAIITTATLITLSPLVLRTDRLDWLLTPVAMAWVVLTVAIALRAVSLRMPGAHWYAAGTGSFMLCFLLLFGLGGNGLNPFPGIYFFDYAKLGYLLEIGCFSAAQVQRILGLGRQRRALRQRQLDDAHSLLSAARALNTAQADASFNRLLLASTSHDLVQPLAALRMTVGALRSQAQPDPSHFHHLDKSLHHVQSLLHSVLDQARTQHREAAQAELVILGDLLSQVAQRHMARASAKGLRLSWVDSSREVRAPALLLHRLLDNLVSNAVRYTVRGRILIGVRQRIDGLELQVLDTGVGLSAAQLAALRQPFQQLNAQAAEGHGLGLYIVRSLCQECGYTMSVRSEPGRGSCFAIHLPAGGA
jgi:signal transduction histidine kinase